MNEALAALFKELTDLRGQITGRGLWLCDDNVTAFKVPLLGNNLSKEAEASLHIISNRVDLVEAFTTLNKGQKDKAQTESEGKTSFVTPPFITTALNDFEADKILPQSFDYALLRLPKSKLVQHHCLGLIQRAIKKKGRLFITGYNQEGIKTVAKNLEEWCDSPVKTELLGKGLRLLTLTLGPNLEPPPLYQEYTKTVTLTTKEGLTLLSKPGIYGFNKIDKGSEFLLDTLLANQITLTGLGVDLGAGYGYLSVRAAHHFPKTKFFATDNNITATHLCKQNFLQYTLDGEVTVEDCGASIPSGSADFILANPPFHQGFSTSKELTKKFLIATKRLLKKRGVAYFVMNRFLDLDTPLKGVGLKATLVAENSQFKIISLVK